MVKKITAYLRNTGFGKTENLVKYVHRVMKGRDDSPKILYLLPNYENVFEVSERIIDYVKKSGKFVSPFIFRGKSQQLATGEYMCSKAEDKYIPGCKDCDMDCLWKKQFDYLPLHDVVISVHNCAYIGIKTVFDTVIIDESLDGVLFRSFNYSEEQWRSYGIEWNTFPVRKKRICKRDCAIYKICMVQKDNTLCRKQSEIVEMQPYFTREPIDDAEYFIRAVFKKTTRVIGSWNFHKNIPEIAIINYLPQLNCDRIFYNSATTSKLMIKDWFFHNYDQSLWEIEFREEKPNYDNPLITFKNLGSIKQEITALNKGVFDHIRKDLGIDVNAKGLIVVKKKHEKDFKDKLKGMNFDITHFPLVGLDKYKDCDFVILGDRFKFDLTTRYLLSELFNHQLVLDLEDAFLIQAIGRLRIGSQYEWLNPNKLIITYFDWDHKQFPNKKFIRDIQTENWIKDKLILYPTISAARLFALLIKEDGVFLHRKIKEFLRVVREVKKTCLSK